MCPTKITGKPSFLSDIFSKSLILHRPKSLLLHTWKKWKFKSEFSHPYICVINLWYLTRFNPGDISSKTNTNAKVRNGPNLLSYLFKNYVSLNPRRVEQY